MRRFRNKISYADATAIEVIQKKLCPQKKRFEGTSKQFKLVDEQLKNPETRAKIETANKSK